MEILHTLFAFFQRGGIPLVALFCISCILMHVCLSKLYFIMVGIRQFQSALDDKWQLKNQNTGAVAPEFMNNIRTSAQAEASFFILENQHFFKSLIRVCPLLGLLGTIWGITEVFEVLSVLGSAHLPALATGISRATIPTVTGMSLIILGLLFSEAYQSIARRKLRKLCNRMGEWNAS